MCLILKRHWQGHCWSKHCTERQSTLQRGSRRELQVNLCSSVENKGIVLHPMDGSEDQQLEDKSVLPSVRAGSNVDMNDVMDFFESGNQLRLQNPRMGKYYFYSQDKCVDGVRIREHTR